MKNITYDFKGKVVVITGANGGIGLQTTIEFLHAGAFVYACDLNFAQIEKHVNSDSVNSKYLKMVHLDVANRDSCHQFVQQLSHSVDILINNAGITRDKTLNKMVDQEWDAVISVNLTGIYNLTKILLDRFNQNSKNNRIINMASYVGLYGNFGQTNYAAAKAGVIGFTQSLAAELGRKGFTVNAIAPGFIETPMTDFLKEEARTWMLNKIPVQRFGHPNDIANACLFLASEEAGYLNGTCLSVDGGLQ